MTLIQGGKHMKKLVSVFLALIMMLTVLTPICSVSASAASYKLLDIPVVRIFGDGEPLYNKDGEKIFHFSEMASIGGSIEKSELYSSVINVVMPFLIEGLGTGNFDRYYAALEKEIGELFAEARLDENGNAAEGQGVSQERIRTMENWLKNPKCRDFIFWYDWRLDPYESAASLKEYIERIKAVTGKDKVSVQSFCLGTSVIVAYIEKYGTDDLYGVSFDSSVVGGAEIISEPISGKFRINGNAINRFLADCNANGTFKVDEFVNQTLDLLVKTGVLGSVVGTVREKLYYKLFEGVTSALALSTFFTWPVYWSAVTEDDYDNAMNYVFGKEGSEKRVKYAGLIEKLDNYDVKVRQKLPEILKQVEADGVKIVVFAKYGYQIVPIIESADAVADQYVSASRASFGATTSTVYGTLDEDYIVNRLAEEKGKYISPDKQIDASTCLFPEYTWFAKGVSHSDRPDAEYEILYAAMRADRQLTVDDFKYSQFMVYDNDTKVMSAMTEENCNTYNWEANNAEDNPTNKDEWVSALIRSLIRWLTGLLKVLVKVISAKAAVTG